MDAPQRVAIGRKRIVNVLLKHGIATLKMLEQKISDAGPNPQRVDPHHLSVACNQLRMAGTLLTKGTNPEWFYLADADPAIIEQRYKYLLTLRKRTEKPLFVKRMGQTAEIAVFKALVNAKAKGTFIGHYADLDKHGDDKLYSKADVDSFNGLQCSPGQLDFIVFYPDAGGMGIEVKNTREWIYPHSAIMSELLSKCVQLDVVPVLVARRIHYSTFSVMNECGVVIHQFYNQLYPYADAELAEEVRQKLTLGFFDVRVGNEPDARLLKFFHTNLPGIADDAREKFDKHKATIAEYVTGAMSYGQFVKEVKGDEGGDDEPPW